MNCQDSLKLHLPTAQPAIYWQENTDTGINAHFFQQKREQNTQQALKQHKHNIQC